MARAWVGVDVRTRTPAELREIASRAIRMATAEGAVSPKRDRWRGIATILAYAVLHLASGKPTRAAS